MSVRARIVDGLRAVTDVDAKRTAPITPAAGVGWPEWRRSDFAIRAGGCAVAELQWWVYVVTAAEPDPDDLDELVVGVAIELAARGIVVDAAEPVGLVLEPGGLPVPAVRWSVRARP